MFSPFLCVAFASDFTCAVLRVFRVTLAVSGTRDLPRRVRTPPRPGAVLVAGVRTLPLRVRNPPRSRHVTISSMGGDRGGCLSAKWPYFSDSCRPGGRVFVDPLPAALELCLQGGLYSPNCREEVSLLKNSPVPACAPRFGPQKADFVALESGYAPTNVSRSSFSTACWLPGNSKDLGE